MDTASIAQTAVTLHAQQRQAHIGLAVLRQQAAADQAVAALIAEGAAQGAALAAAPTPGTGLVVDRSA